MKWYHKVRTDIVTFGARTFLASLASLIPIYFVVQNRINNSIQPYVESHLERVIRNQEERLGIQHFGVPKILYEQPRRVNNGLQGIAVTGEYDTEKDEIYLPPGGAITPEENLTNTLAHLISGPTLHKVKEILDHELGHFYADKLNESLGRGNWPNFTNKQKSDDIIGTMLIAEGIAEYFKRAMNNGKDYFKDSDWPEKLENFLTIDVMYDGGFHLVKPILDRHGKRGIEYLIDNPPSVEELDNLPIYQSRVLQSLLFLSQPKK